MITRDMIFRGIVVLFGVALYIFMVFLAIKLRRRTERRKRETFEASRLAPFPVVAKFRLPEKPQYLFGEIVDCSCCEAKTSTPNDPDPRRRWMIGIPLPTPNEFGLETLNACPKCVREIFNLPENWYETLEDTEAKIKAGFGRGASDV
jgi:hypothetical protein